MSIILHILQNFMIQGGDPTGTGRGGSSIYGYNVMSTAMKLYSVCFVFCLSIVASCCFSGPFEDEISDELKHSGAGILSMANRLAQVLIHATCIVCLSLFQWS